MTWIRSGIYNAWFVLATFALGVFGLGVRMLAPQHSLWLAKLWSRALLGGARHICGIETVVVGREHLPMHGPALIASQHQSAFDTLIWLLLVDPVSYVYKSELARIPLVGPLLAASGQIKIDRGASFAAVKSLLRGADRAVAQARFIVIFPEGTRVVRGAEAEMHRGVAALAARTKLPVIPVATNSGLLWGREAFVKRRGTIHIVIGPPILPGLPQPVLLEALQTAWTLGESKMPACG